MTITSLAVKGPGSK